jgi:hypothetical protein
LIRIQKEHDILRDFRSNNVSAKQEKKEMMKNDPTFAM